MHPSGEGSLMRSMHRLCCFAVAMMAWAQPAIALDDVRTLTVNGRAERLVVPDQSTLTVYLHAVDRDAKAAKAGHDRKLKTLLTITRDAGIAEKKIRTHRSAIQPYYTHKHNATTQRNESVFAGYRAFSNIAITLNDNAKLAPLMEAVAAAGFEDARAERWGSLMQTQYSLSDPRKLQDEMLSEAVANARAKAERLAKATNVSIRGVVAIVENGVPEWRPSPAGMHHNVAMARGAQDSAAVAPPAGEQQLEASVRVTYEIK
jgi:uncharacterized protein YggE